MRYCFIVLFSLAVHQGYAQDMVLLKKKAKRVQTYLAGTDIHFRSGGNIYEAHINGIDNDTLFMSLYDIRKVVNSMGMVFMDTVAIYRTRMHYNQIESIIKERTGFNWRGSGYTLFYGGILLAAAGVGTWIFSEPNTRYYASPELVIGAAVLAGVGYFLKRGRVPEMKLGRKYSLEYVNMN